MKHETRKIIVQAVFGAFIIIVAILIIIYSMSYSATVILPNTYHSGSYSYYTPLLYGSLDEEQVFIDDIKSTSNKFLDIFKIFKIKNRFLSDYAIRDANTIFIELLDRQTSERWRYDISDKGDVIVYKYDLKGKEGIYRYDLVGAPGDELYKALLIALPPNTE